jgi:hypothetical protein
MLMASLLREGGAVGFVHGRFFGVRRTRVNAAFPAVKCDVGIVVNDYGPIDIDVLDVDAVHVHHSGVIEESAVAPFSADETDAAVAETVVNAAVEADVWSPISGMPGVDAIAPAPVAGGPEQADGRSYPGSGHPVVAIVIAPGPVAGGPQMAGPRADGLLVNWKRGRSEPDGNADRNLRGRWSRQRRRNDQQQKSENQATN